jgi:hypothetical protein
VLHHIDPHPRSGATTHDFPSLPFQIPLEPFARPVENLLPANKNIGTTQPHNAATRLHPWCGHRESRGFAVGVRHAKKDGAAVRLGEAGAAGGLSAIVRSRASKPLAIIKNKETVQIHR